MKKQFYYARMQGNEKMKKLGIKRVIAKDDRTIILYYDANSSNFVEEATGLLIVTRASDFKGARNYCFDKFDEIYSFLQRQKLTPLSELPERINPDLICI